MMGMCYTSRKTILDKKTKRPSSIEPFWIRNMLKLKSF